MNKKIVDIFTFDENLAYVETKEVKELTESKKVKESPESKEVKELTETKKVKKVKDIVDKALEDDPFFFF